MGPHNHGTTEPWKHRTIVPQNHGTTEPWHFKSLSEYVGNVGKVHVQKQNFLYFEKKLPPIFKLTPFLKFGGNLKIGGRFFSRMEKFWFCTWTLPTSPTLKIDMLRHLTFHVTRYSMSNGILLHSRNTDLCVQRALNYTVDTTESWYSTKEPWCHRTMGPQHQRAFINEPLNLPYHLPMHFKSRVLLSSLPKHSSIPMHVIGYSVLVLYL